MRVVVVFVQSFVVLMVVFFVGYRTVYQSTRDQ